tara:strand:- start:235 stop:1380 length:1146 start_codon:yes stop_codon:yes gene_type:complete
MTDNYFTSSIKNKSLTDQSQLILVDAGTSVQNGIDINSPRLPINDLKFIVESHTDLGSLAGETGEKGQKGEKGFKGTSGDDGMFGIRGKTGETGDSGDKGELGFVGVKGDKGDVGDSGIDGKRGYTGIQGEKGIKGLRGNQGEEGEMGETGDVGNRGPKGAKGIIGETGDSAPVVYGKTGNVGIPGKKVFGLKGYKGFRGPDSFEKGQTGDRGDVGESYNYNITKKTFKETRLSPVKHGRLLLLLMSTGSSNSISVSSNDVLMQYILKRRFLVFELSNSNNNLLIEKYSNRYIEIDFEPFINNEQSPVMTKVCPIVTKKGNNIGTIGIDWYKDDNNEFNIMFFGVFADSHETVQIPVSSIYSFTSNHLYDVISGEYENLRI